MIYYFEEKVKANQPCILMHYTYKDMKGVIQIGRVLPISFHHSDNHNIDKMESKMNEVDFMFWNNSIEGKQWFKDNHASISSTLINMMMMGDTIKICKN